MPLMTMTRVGKRTLQQEEFGEYMVSNIVAGKSWRINRNFLGFFLSVNNLFDEAFKTGGFEQSRNAILENSVKSFLRQNGSWTKVLVRTWN
ncbi:MAG: hypothetical protein CM15mP59_0370 [Flavobacteriaceae bacterium]|nr:MAG: hypothetical protein CM15mP59_0370 [Flavobacteriaceae bacterium]